MAHYAKINFQSLVAKVIVAEQDFIDSLPDSENWIKTSYNTYGGKHYTQNEDGTRSESEDQSKALRKNFAGINYRYDPDLDAFIPPKFFGSWTLNTETCLWEPPQEKPELDANQVMEGSYYMWNEELYDSTGDGWALIEPEVD